MSISILSLCICLLWQVTVPYKPSDEFHLELEYKFKQRPGSDSQTLDFGETQDERNKRNSSTGPLPYLVVNFKIIKLPAGEVRVRCVNNMGNMVLTKKASVGTNYRLDLGYTDDMKDRVTSHEYNFYFLSSKKEELTRVHLFVQEDGTFLVNGEMRGKF